MQRLRYLAFKNLAEVLAQQPERVTESLQYYQCASEEKEYIQVSVLDRYGTLAAKEGEWSLAKKVFETALSRDPLHPTLQHKLLQLLLHVGDIMTAKELASDFVRVNPYNTLAKRILLGDDHMVHGADILELPSSHPPPPLQPLTPSIFVDHPIEIAAENGTWTELLEKCADLLWSQKTAQVDVLFRFSAAAPDQFPTSDTQLVADADRGEEKNDKEDEGRSVKDNDMHSGMLNVVSIDLTDVNREDGSSKEEDKAKNQRKHEQEGKSLRMTRSKQAQIAEAAGNQGELAEDSPPGSPPLLYLLRDYISLPNEEYASIFDMKQSPDSKQMTSTAGDGGGMKGSMLFQWNNVKEHVVMRAQKMSLVEASIQITKSLLQPDVLYRLVDVKASLLKVVGLLCLMRHSGRSRLVNCISRDEALILSELFAEAAYQTRITIEWAGPSGMYGNYQGLSFDDLLDMTSFWLFQYQWHQSKRQEAAHADSSSQIRFWWAKARYFESKNNPTEALKAYGICQDCLAQSGLSDVVVPHNATDRLINPREISEKLQVVRLHDVLDHASAAAQKLAWQDVKSLLSPVLFSGDQKEAYMAALDPTVWRKALGILLTSARELDDSVLRFRCYLRLIQQLLPPLPSEYKRLFEKSSESESKSSGGQKLAVHVSDIKAMEKFVNTWSSDPCLSEALDCFASESSKQYHTLKEYMANNSKSLEEYMLRCSIQKAIGFLQLCSCDSTWQEVEAAATSKVVAMDMSSKLRRMINDVAVIALSFWRFDQGKQEPTAESLLDWCYNLCESLGDLGSLMENGGRFLSLAFAVLCDARRIFESSVENNSATSGSEDGDCETSIINGFNHCVFWLYGLRIPTIPSEPWGGKAKGLDVKEPSTFKSLLSTQAQVYELWPFVENFLEEEASRDKLKQHDYFLKHVFSIFPCMPEPWDSRMHESWVELGKHTPPEVGANSSCKDPFNGLFANQSHVDGHGDMHGELERRLSVMGSIFSFQARTIPDLGDTLEDAFPDKGVLDPRSDELLDSLFAPCLRALALADHVQQPFSSIDKCGAWAELALLYHEAADLLLRNAAIQLPLREWHHRLDLRQRLNKYRRYANWCTCIAELYVEEGDSETVLELLSLQGLKTYEEVTDGPPEYDQFWNRPKKDDTRLVEYASSALRIYNRASDIDPKDWSFHKQAARAARWLKLPVENWLRRLALACHCAMQREGATLDPIYTLHAARLKLARRFDINEASKNRNFIKPAIDLLSLLSRYCFESECRERAVVVLRDIETLTLQNDVPPEQVHVFLERIKDLVVKDGMDAMEWCLEKHKYFHRASTALAKANENNPNEVIRHLEPLFSKSKGSKGSFAINMYPIAEPRIGKKKKKKSQQQRRPHTGDDNQDANGDVGTDEEEQLRGIEEELEWGRRPAGRAITGIGMDESSVAFFGRMRKALLMYLNALVSVQRYGTLNEASKYFSTSAEYSAAGYDDIRMVAKGYYVLGILSSSLSLCPLNSLVQALAVMSKVAEYQSMEEVLGTMAKMENIAKRVASMGKPTEELLRNMFQLYMNYAMLPDSDKGEANIGEVARKLWKREIVEPVSTVLSILNDVTGASRLATTVPEEQTVRYLLQIRITPFDISATRDCFQMYSLLYVYMLGTSKALEVLMGEVKTLRTRWISFHKAEKSIPDSFLSLGEALYISAYRYLIESYGKIFDQVSKATERHAANEQSLVTQPRSNVGDERPSTEQGDLHQRNQQALREALIRQHSMQAAMHQRFQAMQAALPQQNILQAAMHQRFQSLQAAGPQQNFLRPFLSHPSNLGAWTTNQAIANQNPWLASLRHFQQSHRGEQDIVQRQLPIPLSTQQPRIATPYASPAVLAPQTSTQTTTGTSTPVQSPGRQDSMSARSQRLKNRAKSALMDAAIVRDMFNWLKDVGYAPFNRKLEVIKRAVEDFSLKCLNCYYDLEGIAAEERPTDRDERLGKCDQLIKEWNPSSKRSGTGNADSGGGKKPKQIQTHLTDFINT